MKNRPRICIPLLLWGWVGLIFDLCAQPDAYTMSLQECIDYALEHNTTLKNGEIDIDASHRKVQETLATGLPQLSGNINLGYNFERPVSFLPGEIVGGEPGTFVPIQFSPAYTGRMILDFEQMIFVGSYFVGLKAAKSYVNLSRQEKVKLDIDIIENVSKAYYLCLINQAREKLIQKNHDRLTSLLHNTKAMYEAGFAEQVDVDRIRVQYNNANVEKENFSRTLALNYAMLKYHMGLDIDASLVLKDRIENATIEELVISPKQESTYENRIEYKILQNNMQLLKLDLKNIGSQYLPSIKFYGNYGLNTGTSNLSHFFDFRDRWFAFGTIGLTLNMPLFDGLQKARRIQQKKIAIQQTENTKKQLKQEIKLQQKQATAKLKDNIGKMKIQKENMELAENVYRVAIIKYEAGVGSNIEVTNADASLIEAQTNYYASLYDALVAKIDLEKALGKLIK